MDCVSIEIYSAETKPELEASRAQRKTAEREHAELRVLGVEALKQRLAQCFAEEQQALNAGKWQDAEALVDIHKKLTAALRSASEMQANDDF